MEKEHRKTEANCERLLTPCEERRRTTGNREPPMHFPSSRWDDTGMINATLSKNQWRWVGGKGEMNQSTMVTVRQSLIRSVGAEI